ncbi:MAG: glycosyltransferase [Candidatus Accumulibacter sp.]|jgi:hypothetical protein|uniref:glycosyltransferase n=1 Tax=Accumulibacter sp. TaxID=2053492 RepID=UPI00258F7F63|nr:glycosyltransferase [Accumulibacter sp.]MBK8115180.1 glycosyltransferase [Accumulibacter sp.]
MEKFHWRVHSLVRRTNTIFGFGWLFHEDSEIAVLSLLLSFSARTCAIRAEHGKARTDVQQAYPCHRLALNSGFILYGGCPTDLGDMTGADLVGTLENGDAFELQLPAGCPRDLDQPATEASRKWLLLQAGMMLKRGWGLVRQGQLSNLVDQARRFLGQRGTFPHGSVSEVIAEVMSVTPARIVLVIDHDLGGGANQYSSALVAEKIRRGAAVLLLSYKVHTLSHVLLLSSRKANRRYTIHGTEFILDLAREIPLDEITYNTAVSFAKPEEIPQLIAKLKRIGNPRLTMLLHEYFMLCPSHFLLNDQGEFCGLPERGRCQTCLDTNQQGYATLFLARNMQQWRALWGSALSLADEIVTFSNSSGMLLSRAYPGLDLSRVSVTPHTAKHVRLQPVQAAYVASLRIGVVGHIAYHKGAKIVRELAREILRRKSDIKIVVFGTLDASCDPAVVQVTGSYKQARLPALIRERGANTFLFPSICPETFSYVVQELMGFGLPVACLDLGAPPERLRDYSKGQVLADHSAASVLDALIDLHRRVYLSD